MTLFQSLTTSIQHSCSKDPHCNSFSISYSGRCTKKKDRLLWISKIAKTKVSLAFTAILQVHNIMALVSVKIFGTLYCLLALLMVVHKIWWVNCDKPYWEGEETGQEEKKTAFDGSVSTILSRTDLNAAISTTATESQNVIYTSFEKIMILSARLPMLKFFCKWTTIFVWKGRYQVVLV